MESSAKIIVDAIVDKSKLEVVVSKYQSENINELATALAKAQSEIKHAEKSSNNPFFKSKYAALPDVFDAARPYLAKNGLSVTQATDYDADGVFIITQLIHSSGQWMRSFYPVKPVKNDPQGLGSALTYARRYSYSSLVGVVSTDDDDDGNAASGNETPAQQRNKSVYANQKERSNVHRDIMSQLNAAQNAKEVEQIMKDNEPEIMKMESSLQQEDRETAIDIKSRGRTLYAQFKALDK